MKHGSLPRSDAAGRVAGRYGRRTDAAFPRKQEASDQNH